MKKFLTIFVSLMLVLTVLTGCARAKDTASSAEDAITQAAQGASQSGSNSDTAAAFYSGYMEEKSVVLNRITDGLSSNPDTVMSALSFLGASLSDLYLFPALYFGLGETSVSTALAVMGAKDVTYDESGNQYTVTYKDSDGHVSVLTGTYDNGKSLVCVGSMDGVDSVFSEVYRTAFGYVGQFYAIANDGTASLYQFAFNGEDGVVGLTTGGERPAALNGSEAADFPKTAKEWYAIAGDTITGVNAEGKAVSFEYTPTDD
ncbi:MAG: hypothetical protein GX417_13190 [Clostridiales bacterium]|nr:hypothetical protein [Clostridiales bacterium]